MLHRLVPLIVILAGFEGAITRADDRRPDLVVADFEGTTYAAGWRAEGTAFGPGPASGALPGQMSVEGFEGRGLVNSFAGGDDSEGTLTSPPFRLERRYLNFLVGGGRWPGETCVDLVVAGQAVRTATGPNDHPGGSERLAWATWDVADLAGQTATLRVVDHRKGGWGHINLDQVVQADTRRAAAPTSRAIVATARYLHLPVRNQNPVQRVQVTDQAGQVVRDFDIRLDDGAGAADFVTFLDLAPFRGQTLTVAATLPESSRALAGITLSDQLPGGPTLYAEADRPRFHFSSRRGWLNDPNGLVWQNGSYHLFYQHNPYGWDWGNMHWGHATSPDLVHWTEQPIALYPRQYGDWAFSGSAVVDKDNTSGFGSAAKPALVAAYTSTGRGECIVWSHDEGRTWTEFAGNPVVRHNGRDPRLVWHEPTRRWIMAVYEEGDGKDRAIVFHSSPDLKAWTTEGRIDGFYECPDLFELPVNGSTPARSLWVISAADGQYRLGQFDGHKFTPETPKLTLWHGDFYAAQTFSNTPDGRRIQIGWGRDITFPGMPFNQQMTIPCELTLRTTPDGPRLCAAPVAEVAQLGRWDAVVAESNLGTVEPRTTTFANLNIAPGDGLDLALTFGTWQVGRFTVTLFGSKVAYDPEHQTLDVAGLKVPVAPEADSVRLRILADRRSLEVFVNGGRVAISRRVQRDSAAPALVVERSNAARNIEVRTIRSAW